MFSRSGGGYCSEAVSFVRALSDHSDLRVTIDQHGDSISRRFLEELPPATSASLQQLYKRHVDPSRSIAVCHSEPGAWVPSKYPTTLCPPSGAAFSVGRTMFETDRLPDGWSERLNRMDEVWVPTEFARGVFEAGGVAPAKLVVVGEPVDVDEFDPATVPPLPHDLIEGAAGEGGPWGAALAGAGGRRVTRFLSVFKWEYRKAWDVLLKAFLGGFVAEEPAVLYVLTSAYHSTSDFAGEMRRFQESQLSCAAIDAAADEVLAAHGGGDGQHASSVDDALPRPSDFCIDFAAEEGSGGAGPAAGMRSGNETVARRAAELRASVRRLLPSLLPRYRVLRRLSQSELPSAYASVDALVLPSRGEGWGRPHVEAMSMGLPVLATNWSGPTAFLDESNGFPVPYTHLRPVPDGPFAGHLMAEPDERALRAAMRAVMEDPAEAARRGARAREDMKARFSPGALAEAVRAHVARIEAAVAGRPARTGRARRGDSAPLPPRVPSEADDSAARAHDGARGGEL